jgi:hypothetical protein
MTGWQWVAVGATVVLVCCTGEEPASSAGAAGAAGAADAAPTDGDGATGDGGGDGGAVSKAQALRAALEADGFVVQTGALAFGPLFDCDKLTTCFGNNPSSPYGHVKLPAGPGQSAANPMTGADGLSAIWRLRADEAVIYLGRTPPRARYFGFRSYLFDRAATDAGASTRTTLFASLGDSLNQLVVATAPVAGADAGADAGAGFDAEILLISSADRGVVQRVKAAASSAGVPESIANVDEIPSSLLAMGLHESADTLALLERVALFDDEAAGNAFVASPPGVVLRATPSAPPSADPYPMPTLRPRGTGTNEAHLGASLDQLEAAVIAKHAGLAHTSPQQATVLALDGFACAAQGKNCNGDNRDALYEVALAGALGDGADDFLMVIGVNHEVAGKGVYSNFAVYDVSRMLGVGAVDSRGMKGSASAFVPGEPAADQLFACKVARHCDGAGCCLEVAPSASGVPVTAPMGLAFRAYLEKQTRTGPKAEELLRERVIKFSAK